MKLVDFLRNKPQWLKSAETRFASLRHTFPARLTANVLENCGAHDAGHMAASTSYYALLSLLPLILGVSAILGIFIGSEGLQKAIIDFIVQYLPGSEEFIDHSVSSLIDYRGTIGIVSVIGLIWAGSGLFGSITIVINRAWGIQKDQPFYKNKPRQIAMALGISIIFGLSISLSAIIQWATSIEIGGRTIATLLGGETSTAVLRMPTILISFGIFASLYKIIPNTNTKWNEIWLGSIVACILFEASKFLFVWYLDEYSRYDQLYGNMASIIILMVWTYISAFILILGAEIASEHGRLKRSDKS